MYLITTGAIKLPEGLDKLILRWIGTRIEKVTCFLDDGHILGDGTGLTAAHPVVGKHSEAVGVAHDEVRDGGVQPVVVLQHREPLLRGVMGAMLC